MSFDIGLTAGEVTGCMTHCGDGFYEIAAAPHLTVGRTVPSWTGGEITPTNPINLGDGGFNAPMTPEHLRDVHAVFPGPILVPVQSDSNEESDKEPGVKELSVGDVVWSKTTGEGPYSIVSETVTEVEEDSKGRNYKQMHQVSAMLLRDNSGRFKTIPTGDLTTVKARRGKPSGYSWMTKIFLVLGGLALGGIACVGLLIAAVIAVVSALL